LLPFYFCTKLREIVRKMQRRWGLDRGTRKNEQNGSGPTLSKVFYVTVQAKK